VRLFPRLTDRRNLAGVSPPPRPPSPTTLPWSSASNVAKPRARTIVGADRSDASLGTVPFSSRTQNPLDMSRTRSGKTRAGRTSAASRYQSNRQARTHARTQAARKTGGPISSTLESTLLASRMSTLPLHSSSHSSLRPIPTPRLSSGICQAFARLLRDY
jgi:hypothetical protein